MFDNRSTLIRPQGSSTSFRKWNISSKHRDHTENSTETVLMLHFEILPSFFLSSLLSSWQTISTISWNLNFPETANDARGVDKIEKRRIGTGQLSPPTPSRRKTVTSARMSRSISQVPSIWSLEHARDTATCSWKKIPPTSSPVYDYVMLYMCPARARPTRVPFEAHTFFFLVFTLRRFILPPHWGGEDGRRREKVSRKYEFLLFISLLFFSPPFFFLFLFLFFPLLSAIPCRCKSKEN